MPNKVLSATALATALAVSSPASADVPSPVSYDVRDTISGSVNNVTNNGVIPLTQEVKF